MTSEARSAMTPDEMRIDAFNKWYRDNGYYHDTVSDRKVLMQEAWLASRQLDSKIIGKFFNIINRLQGRVRANNATFAHYGKTHKKIVKKNQDAIWHSVVELEETLKAVNDRQATLASAQGWRPIEEYKGGEALFFQPEIKGRQSNLPARCVVDNAEPYPRGATHFMELPQPPSRQGCDE